MHFSIFTKQAAAVGFLKYQGGAAFCLAAHAWYFKLKFPRMAVHLGRAKVGT